MELLIIIFRDFSKWISSFNEQTKHLKLIAPTLLKFLLVRKCSSASVDDQKKVYLIPWKYQSSAFVDGQKKGHLIPWKLRGPNYWKPISHFIPWKSSCSYSISWLNKKKKAHYSVKLISQKRQFQRLALLFKKRAILCRNAPDLGRSALKWHQCIWA